MSELPSAQYAKAIERLADVVELVVKPVATVAQTFADAHRLRKLTAEEIASADFKLRAQINAEKNLFRHQRNLEAIAEKARLVIEDRAARKLLPENAGESAHDPDWTHKWAAYAKDSSDEDIRTLWAKVLAGEIIQPGKFSLRLLHTISLLRKSEAQSFSLLANYISTDAEGRVFALDSYWGGEWLLKKFGLDGNLFRRLENLGLVQRMKDTRGTPIYLHRATVRFGEHSYALQMLRVPDTMTSLFVMVDVRQLTELGEELYTLCPVEPDKEYEEEFFKRMLGHEGSGWNVAIVS